MALPSLVQFMKMLAFCSLLDEGQLEHVRSLAEEDPSTDVREFALKLLELGYLTRWQANQLLAGRLQFHLGKYRLIDLIGRGSMGNVFHAEHVTMGRDVALKLLSKRLDSKPEVVSQFYDEARVIASLNHRNIVHVYNVENVDSRHFIVMELVEGIDLQKKVDRSGPMPVRTATDYIRQAAEGLDHAHTAGLMHCDVKPSNLIVNHQEVIKILDMGSAQQGPLDPANFGTSSMSTSSRARAMLGTVDYMAPEQATDDPDMDHRVDIYSLGCTLYFLMTGHAPFAGGTLAEKILKHQQETPTPILRVREDTPSSLAILCGRMLSKDPDDRIQTAREVADLMLEFHA
jgi:eukaryotic-like serine/threonine-protein kinase